MKIYVFVQRTERSEYRARQIRRWIRRSFCLADFLLDVVIGAALLMGVLLTCLVDGMDELLFLKLMFGCTVTGGIALMLKSAIAAELNKRKPKKRIGGA